MNILIFDTETVGMQTQTLLNVGYKIIDLDLDTHTAKTLCARDYVIRKHFLNDMLMINDKFVGAEKWLLMKDKVAKGGTKLRTIEQTFAQMTKDLLRFPCCYGFAFNSDFDTDKFEKTAREYGIDNPLDGIEIIDLWGLAYHFICDKDDYKEWMRDNEMFTPTGRFLQTSVEGITAFLTKDVTFKEEHTALSDVEWEQKILIECAKRGCDITKPLPRGANIPSGKVFKKILVVGGKEIEIEFTSMSRKWDSAERIVFNP